MNKRLVIKLLGGLMGVEAALLIVPVIVALIYGEDCSPFLYTICLLLVVGMPLWCAVQPGTNDLNAKDGLAVAGFSWILLSLFGSLPFVFSGTIPRLADAFFETVSGFTTTGATVLSEVESLPKGVLFWRSFTHWIGGMGVLVLTLALLPKLSGRTSHLAKAESTGPVFSKLAPRMGDTAKILYLIYGALTILEFIVLILSGMPVYDAAIHAVSTAGTGGFSCKNNSIGAYSPLTEWIVAVFMMLFGINFGVYFHMIKREFNAVAKNEELFVYFGFVLISTLTITLNILPQYGDFGTSLRKSFFQVNTIMSTTGFNSCDYNLWPQFSRVLLTVLTVLGACAGSTAGGLKISRVVMLFKSGIREVKHMISPRKISVVRMEGKAVAESTMTGLGVYIFIYVFLLMTGAILISLDPIQGNSITTSFTASLTCISNVGPGFGSVVGPYGNFGGFAPLTKVWMCFMMLAGRLEFYPLLVLISPSLYKKNG